MAPWELILKPPRETTIWCSLRSFAVAEDEICGRDTSNAESATFFTLFLVEHQAFNYQSSLFNAITWFCRINWSLSLRATLSSWERYCNVSLGLEIFKIRLVVSVPRYKIIVWSIKGRPAPTCQCQQQYQEQLHQHRCYYCSHCLFELLPATESSK